MTETVRAKISVRTWGTSCNAKQALERIGLQCQYEIVNADPINRVTLAVLSGRWLSYASSPDRDADSSIDVVQAVSAALEKIARDESVLEEIKGRVLKFTIWISQFSGFWGQDYDIPIDIVEVARKNHVGIFVDRLNEFDKRGVPRKKWLSKNEP